MNLKLLLLTISICLLTGGCKTNKQENQGLFVESVLGYPFGTLLETDVVVIDGDDLGLKQYMDKYLLKVISVENKKLDKPVTLTFEDDSGKFPNDSFKLYESVHKERTDPITSDILEEIENGYIGKTFRIVVYETGGFTGLPDGYSKYQIAQGTGFYFKNSLVVVADLTNKF